VNASVLSPERRHELAGRMREQAAQYDERATALSFEGDTAAAWEAHLIAADFREAADALSYDD